MKISLQLLVTGHRISPRNKTGRCRDRQIQGWSTKRQHCCVRRWFIFKPDGNQSMTSQSWLLPFKQWDLIESYLLPFNIISCWEIFIFCLRLVMFRESVQLQCPVLLRTKSVVPWNSISEHVVIPVTGGQYCPVARVSRTNHHHHTTSPWTS